MDYDESLFNLIEEASKDKWIIKLDNLVSFSWVYFECRAYSIPVQLWKIHITCSNTELEILFKTVLRFLIKEECSFKIPNKEEAVVLINAGGATEALVGKIVTAYPRSEREFTRLINCLSAIWPISLGPRVLSDVVSRYSSAVFARYGVGRPSQYIMDHRGLYSFALQHPDGRLVADVRDLSGRQAEWIKIPKSCQHQEIDNRTEFKTSEGQIYIKIKLLHKSPKSKVYLGIDAVSVERVAIKECRKGVAGDLLGYSSTEKLRWEFHKLKSVSAFADYVPSALAFFEGDENSFLIMSDVEGVIGNKLGRLSLDDAIPCFVDLVDKLHSLGYVHRDIKLSNFSYNKNKSFLLDFELCTAKGEIGPIGGTRAYFAPEALSQPVDSSVDIYALGFALSHALLRYDPALLPSGRGKVIGFCRLCGFLKAVSLIAQMTALDPKARPRAQQVKKVLATTEWSLRIPSVGVSKKLASASWSVRACMDACHFTRRFRLQNGAWKNNHFQKHFICEGINLGAAGILIGLASVQNALVRSDFDSDLREGANYLSRRDPLRCLGLFTGNAGVALALAIVGRMFNSSSMKYAVRNRLTHEEPTSECDLFVGVSGVVFSACLITEILNEDWPLVAVRQHVERLKSEVKRIDGLVLWGVDDGKSYNHFLGAAHGSSGIALALIKYGLVTHDNQLVDLGFEALRSITVKYRSSAADAIPFCIESKREIAPISNWCHGIAGYLWCLINSDVGGFLNNEISWALSLFREARPIGNATFCHGLSGQLELWRMISRYPQYAEESKLRCAELVGALRILHEKVDGLIALPSDEAGIFTPDLWIGSLGPAVAIALWKNGSVDSLLSENWLRSLSLRK